MADPVNIDVFVRDEQVFNGLAAQFADGWRASTFELSTTGEYCFELKPDRSRYFRDGETVIVKVVAFGVEEQYSFIAEARPFSFSTYNFILQSVRSADEVQ